MLNQGINSASLGSLASRYDNPVRFLSPKECLKIPVLNTLPDSLESASLRTIPAAETVKKYAENKRRVL